MVLGVELRVASFNSSDLSYADAVPAHSLQRVTPARDVQALADRHGERVELTGFIDGGEVARVLIGMREHVVGEQERVVCVGNFSPRAQTLNSTDLTPSGAWRDLLAEETGARDLPLAPYQARWIVESQ